MANVMRQPRRAVSSIDEHLHERKRIRAIKRPARGIEKSRALTEKRFERLCLVRGGERFDQLCAIALRLKRKHAINQPIRRFDEYATGRDVRLFSINHLQ